MAASLASFKKSHFPVLQEHSRIQPKKSKSCSNFFCKALIIILVLVLIPLFPAQAPDFINQITFISKFWELLHLLVIGVAVSYGLFCRKSGKMEVDNQSRNDASSAYLSGVLNVSSFFEDQFENLCVSDENKDLQNWDSLKIHSESMRKERYSIDGGKKIRSLRLGSGIEDRNEADKENVSQIWNSQYFPGETLVVVADRNCAVDEHKPLGLPIRSLRSRISDTEKTESISRSGSSSSLKGSLGKNCKGRVEKFRGPIPINLEKKFEEVAGPSTIPWQSRSGRTEMGEEFSNKKPPCHCRPHSGGEFEFENLKSRSFQHPISSRTNCVSLVASKQKTEKLESQNDIKGSLDNLSLSTIASVNDGGSFSTKARGFSIGSSGELDRRRTSKCYFNDSNIRAMQDMLDREKKNSDSINTASKLSNSAKVLPRGRSVRTIRSGIFTSDKMKMKENYSKQTDDKVRGISDQFEAPELVKRVKGGETKDPPVHTHKLHLNKVHPVPKETFSEDHNDEMQDFTDSTLVSENNSELESESDDDIQESSDEKEAEPDPVDDSEIEGSEVDRKADEFIAKFREQMRLQKIASVKRYGCQP